MGKKDKEKYSDFSNVHHMRQNLIPEEFPEGSFGQAINHEKPITSSKSTPWKEGQRRTSAFTYAYRELHEDLPRQAPGSHPIHDEPGDVHPQEE
ncbi:hypothetical protein ACFFIS_09225 [Virgibacillus soli]|uniref:Cytosolic protein n=1 Tax=Paracerasibacillus soli TaxID=480284 RepID=A0ABU5CSD7_9BACI|nr:hypothetical protein [Virgibacillus soli]MDY0408791.1 hypothetical protein [Virgibacillus soli]